MNYYKQIESHLLSLTQEKVELFTKLVIKNHKHISEEDVFKISNQYLSTNFKTDKKCKECSEPPSEESVTGNYCDEHLDKEQETMCQDSQDESEDEE